MPALPNERNSKETNGRTLLQVFTLKATEVNSVFCYTMMLEQSHLECMNQGEVRG